MALFWEDLEALLGGPRSVNNPVWDKFGVLGRGAAQRGE